MLRSPDRVPVRRAAIVKTGLMLALALGVGGCGAQNPRGSSTRSLAGGRAALPGTGRPLLTIGDKNFTEQFILGELYAQALTAQGYSVVLNRDIGPTEVTLPALYSGRLSMYPEYIGTWNTVVSGDGRQFRTIGGALRAARRYGRAHSLQLLRPTRFSDTGAIAVTNSYATEHALVTIRDLRTVAPNLTMGAPPQFQAAPSGLGGLEQNYGFVPAAFKPLGIGSQYQALDQQTVQAAEVSTTDGQLRSGHYTLLGDPRRAFGWGQVVPVVPDKVLRSEGPAFVATVDRVSSLLTLSVVRELNADVDLYNQDPALVAKRFLLAHGLLPGASG